MNCALCDLKETSKIYKDTSEFIIIECKDCHVPMVVWKDHTMKIAKNQWLMMIDELIVVGKKVFGMTNFRIDMKQRKIPDHLHWHARKR